MNFGTPPSETVRASLCGRVQRLRGSWPDRSPCGSDAAGTRTTAVRRGHGDVLNGINRPPSQHGGVGEIFVVTGGDRTGVGAKGSAPSF